jgi:RNA polymerase primary sigma factor
MAKTNAAAEPEEKSETGDAPLIDLNEASLKKLMARAKKRGYITYDEINEALPQDQMSSEQIEDVMSAFSEMGVNIVENEEADEDDPNQDADTGVDEVDGVGETFILEKKKETVDRTDDPVRMYLREMGAVELLSREGEIAIAKRIEAGRDTMIWGLCESPITFNAIIEWSNEFRRIVQPGPEGRARGRHRQEGDGRGQPAPRHLDRQEIHQPRPAVPGPDPGGQYRPDEGGR